MGEAMGDKAADELEIRALAARYAIGADQGNAEMFRGVFLPDARLIVFRAPEMNTPWNAMSGHAEIGRVPSILAERYTRTFHFLGQSVYDIGPSEATGLVYCLAHHFTAVNHGGTNYVMHMQYRDIYRRNDKGEWKIAERRAEIHWTDTRVSNSIGA